MSSKQLSILENANRPVVLSEPVVQSLPGIAGFEGYNYLFLEFDVLINETYPLLPGLPSEFVDIANLDLFINQNLHRLLSLQMFFSDGLLKQHLVVAPGDLGLQPAARHVWIIDRD